MVMIFKKNYYQYERYRRCGKMNPKMKTLIFILFTSLTFVQDEVINASIDNLTIQELKRDIGATETQ